MAIKTHSCISVACDVCKNEFEGYWGVVRHYDDRDEAIQDARDYEWHVALDGSVVCSTEDTAHRDAIRKQHAAGMEPDHYCWILGAEEDEAEATPTATDNRS